MWVPGQAAIVLVGLVIVSQPPIDVLQLATSAVAVGITGGMLSVPAAHELMHRRSSRSAGEALMLLLSYHHFAIEHVRGHHIRVATPDDPATARLGETLYTFLPRSVLGGIRSAWRAEAARMREQRRPVISVHNRTIRGLVLLAVLYAAIGIGFGAAGAMFFAIQSAVGIVVLESVNYVQHYGLMRRGTVGNYEAITPMHSWNSGHRVSNWFLLNVGRHADHHCDATKSYLALGTDAEAPQLPTGLVGMFILALFPPLWRGLMDPLVEHARARASLATPNRA
jgi:alkane 1-monooxygenase